MKRSLKYKQQPAVDSWLNLLFTTDELIKKKVQIGTDSPHDSQAQISVVETSLNVTPLG